MLANETLMENQRLAGEELGHFRVLGQDVHAFLFELAAERAVEHGRVAKAGLDRLRLNPLIADDLHLNLVALLVEAEMLEP